MSSSASSIQHISVGIAHPMEETSKRLAGLLTESSGEVRFHAASFSTSQEIIRAADAGQIHVLILGLDLEGQDDLTTFVAIQERFPELPVIILETPGSILGFDSLKHGARDFFPTDTLTAADLEKSIRRSLIHQTRRNEAHHYINLLDNLLENIPEHIYFKDRSSRFIRVNRAMAGIFRVDKPEEMIGKTDFDYFTPEHAQPSFDDEQMLITQQEPCIQKFEKETYADGRIRYALSTKMPLLAKNGRIIGTFGISHDVTHLQETEQALEKERNELRIATAELTEKNAEMQASLTVAREIQTALLPRRYPCFPPEATSEKSLLHFDHRYIPANAVGGDFFIVLPISPTKAGVLICDVMGHGPGAALVTAIVRTLCEDLRQVADRPGDFMSGLNMGLKSLLHRVDGAMLCTGFYLTLEATTGEVQFCNAAHPSPIHLNRSAVRAAFLSDYDTSHGPVLGFLDDALYPTSTFQMQKGDVVLLFTDGLFEVTCENEEEYGELRLLKEIAEYATLEPAAIMDTVLNDITRHAAHGFEDDVCLVTVERR